MARKRYRFSSYAKREEFVEFLLTRDGDICKVCNKKMDINVPAKLQNGKDNPFYISLDHIIPIYSGGPNSKENLRLLHKTCNSFLGKLSDPRRKRKTVSRFLLKDNIVEFGE